MDISGYQDINTRMGSRGKRPIRNLTPTDKIRAIRRIRNGETKASVSRDIGVPESTLRGWCKNEQKLRFMCNQLGAEDQITEMKDTKTPPEKRSRFYNDSRTPKFSGTSSFDEFKFNHLPLNPFICLANGTNGALEKMAFNEVMETHILTADNSAERQTANISGAIGGSILATEDFISQLVLLQNLNLLSLFSPNFCSLPNNNPSDTFDGVKQEVPLLHIDDTKDNPKNSTSNNILNTQGSTSSDPAENSLLSSTIQNDINNDSAIASIKNNNIAINSDSSEVASNLLNFSLPLSPCPLQIPNVISTCDSERGNNAAWIEWYKVFNAGLNLMALAAAAAALQPNENLSVSNYDAKECNSLDKALTKTVNLVDSANSSIKFVSSDAYSESEPENLSLRPTVAAKFSRPANDRSESPMQSNGTCLPVKSDGEH